MLLVATMFKGSASIASTSGSGVAVGGTGVAVGGAVVAAGGALVAAGCGGAVVAVGSGSGVDVGSGSSLHATADAKIATEMTPKSQIRTGKPKRIVRPMSIIVQFSRTQR